MSQDPSVQRETLPISLLARGSQQESNVRAAQHLAQGRRHRTECDDPSNADCVLTPPPFPNKLRKYCTVGSLSSNSEYAV